MQVVGQSEFSKGAIFKVTLTVLKFLGNSIRNRNEATIQVKLELICTDEFDSEKFVSKMFYEIGSFANKPLIFFAGRERAYNLSKLEFDIKKFKKSTTYLLSKREGEYITFFGDADYSRYADVFCKTSEYGLRYELCRIHFRDDSYQNRVVKNFLIKADELDRPERIIAMKNEFLTIEKIEFRKDMGYPNIKNNSPCSIFSFENEECKEWVRDLKIQRYKPGKWNEPDYFIDISSIKNEFVKYVKDKNFITLYICINERYLVPVKVIFDTSFAIEGNITYSESNNEMLIRKVDGYYQHISKIKFDCKPILKLGAEISKCEINSKISKDFIFIPTKTKENINIKVYDTRGFFIEKNLTIECKAYEFPKLELLKKRRIDDYTIKFTTNHSISEVISENGYNVNEARMVFVVNENISNKKIKTLNGVSGTKIETDVNGLEKVENKFITLYMEDAFSSVFVTTFTDIYEPIMNINPRKNSLGIFSTAQPDFTIQLGKNTTVKKNLTVKGDLIIEGSLKNGASTSTEPKNKITGDLNVSGKIFSSKGQAVSTNTATNQPIAGVSGTMTFPVDLIALENSGSGRNELVIVDNQNRKLFIDTNNSYSDINIKTNIKATDEIALKLIEAINFKSFEYKQNEFGNSPQPQGVGIIAQELQNLNSSLVYKSGEYLSIDNFRLLCYALKGMQEFLEEIKMLKEEIKMLKGEKNDKY